MRIRIRVLKFLCILLSCSSTIVFAWNAFLSARCVASGMSICERNFVVA